MTWNVKSFVSGERFNKCFEGKKLYIYIYNSIKYILSVYVEYISLNFLIIFMLYIRCTTRFRKEFN